MPHASQHDDELCIYKLRLAFAATCRLDIALSGYLCGADGAMIEGADVWQGELRLTATAREFRNGSLWIAPCSTAAFDNATPTASTLMARRAFHADFRPLPGQLDYNLPEIPEALWRAWLDSVPAHQAVTAAGPVGGADFLFY